MDDGRGSRRVDPRRRGALALGIGCAAIAAFKLWLVWPDEIVARAYPLDQQRYAEMIESLAAGRWLGAYDHTTLIRGPTYPLWAAAVHASGAPLRLANEVLLIAAALLFATALRRLGQPRAAVLAAFALLVLQPHSLAVNRELLAASFYLPVLLVALAGLLLALAAAGAGRAAAHAAWAGLALGVLWNTRPETPLVALLPAVAAVFELFARRGRGAAWGVALGRAAALAGLSAAGIAAVTASLGAVNERHYGVSITSDLSAPGFVAAGRALLSIEHAAPRRYVPVPAEVRRRAYAASPALRELAATLESPGWAHYATCNLVGVCDDLGGGWFIWWLREAAWRAGHFRSAAAADAFFRRVASELEAACASGELACRRPLLNYPMHPYPETWAPHLGRSLRRVVGRIASAGEQRDLDLERDPPGTPAAVRALFDRVAQRREGLTSNGRVRVRGSASLAGDSLASVVIGRGSRGPDPRAPHPQASAPGSGPMRRERFELDLEKPTRELAAMDAVLRLTLRSGAQVELPLPAAGEQVERHGVRVSIDALEETGDVDVVRRGVRRVLWWTHALLIRALGVAGLLAAAALLLPPWRGRFAAPVFGAVVLIAALVAARVALLVLIDASSFSARSSRYVYPIVSLSGIALLLLVREAWWRLRRASPRPPATPPR